MFCKIGKLQRHHSLEMKVFKATNPDNHFHNDMQFLVFTLIRYCQLNHGIVTFQTLFLPFTFQC